MGEKFTRGETLGEGWGWRRPLVFKEARSDAPGENAAWGEFYGNGAQASDWADLRVTTADRVVMPLKVLVSGASSAKSDFVRVAFATKGDGPYYAWWGNSKATKPAEELEIRRGVYVEATSAAGRPAAQLFGRGRGAGRGAAGGNGATGGDFLGAYFLPEMLAGFDPLGEQRAVMLHYAAQFKIDRAIKPQMAFTVSGAGLMEIDGKEVAQDRGGVNGRVRAPVGVDLAAGWHSIDVKQVVQGGQQTVISVVWQRPGEQAYSVLPSAAIAPAARAVAGPLEKVGATFTPDVAVEPVAEGFVPPSFYALRYGFEVMYPTSMKPGITWEFGDGQVAKGLKKVNHVYFLPGVYAVKATLEMGGTAPLVTTVRVEVKDRMYEKFPRPPEDPVKAMAVVLKEYEPGKLAGDAILRGVSFFESANDAEGTLAWGKAWLEKKEEVQGTMMSESLLEEETLALARLAEGRKQYAQAAEFYRLASAKPVRMEMRLKMMWLGVAELCDNAGEADKALEEAHSWERKIDGNADAQVALVQGALAYAAIAKGDEQAAKGAVMQAEKARAGAGATFGGGGSSTKFNEMQIRQGVLARNVENYIRTKDFDTAWKLINAWDMEMPSAAWEGFTRTLRVKLAVAEGRPLAAAQMALAHAKANPGGFYAAELLLRASENFQGAGKAEESRTVMEMLRTKYPESPYARGEK